MDKNELIDEISKVIRRYLKKEDFKIFLFGSWAKESAEPASDIDIAIMGEKEIDDFLLMRIKGEVEAIPTLRKIDIIDLKAVDEKFKENILRYAKQL